MGLRAPAVDLEEMPVKEIKGNRQHWTEKPMDHDVDLTLMKNKWGESRTEQGASWNTMQTSQSFYQLTTKLLNKDCQLEDIYFGQYP
jgi:hypothetical protein